MTGSAQIIRSDARNLPIADSSVDLVVTSPPYFALRSYKDGGEHYAEQIGSEATPAEFVQALLEVTAECVRVLKPSGSIWVNLGDKYAGGGGFAPNAPSNVRRRNDASGVDGAMKFSPRLAARQPTGSRKDAGVRSKSLMGIPWRYALACIDDLGLILRAEVIWSKPNGLPESVTDRVRRSHEQWFHFTKSERYYSAVDELREAHLHGGRGPTWSDRKAAGNPTYCPDAGHSRMSGGMAGNVRGRLPGSVWSIVTEPLKVPDDLGVDHFAAFPTEWPRRIILGWSPESGTVLDPFGGTGTTAAVAKALGRHGIHNDMSADYNRLADWRINGAGFDRVWAKVHNKELVKRDDTQLALFDDTAA